MGGPVLHIFKFYLIYKVNVGPSNTPVLFLLVLAQEQYSISFTGSCI